MKHGKYNSSVKEILKDSTDPALTHIRDLRDSENINHTKILEQKLMSFRLALKAGNSSSLNENELQTVGIDSEFLRAEAFFVRGVILIHKEKLLEAVQSFEKAAELYNSENLHEKSLLSLFNSLIANANSGNLTPQKELAICHEILLKSREKGVLKIQGLCLRQKSYCYFNSQRYRAALQEIIEALPLIEAHCPPSDYHLSLVHAADCAFELKNMEQAQTYLDYLPRDTNARITFPLAYLKTKLSGINLDLSLFEDINSHWKQRYEDYLARRSSTSPSLDPKWYWDAKTHWILKDNKQRIAKIKPQSLEGRFLKVLMKGPQSKEFISEVLWPDFSNSENLDDRFFRLKNRLQKKLGTPISFDGQRYFLPASLRWQESKITSAL